MLQEPERLTWHLHPEDELLKLLETTREGLTSEENLLRLKKVLCNFLLSAFCVRWISDLLSSFISQYGPNEITPPPQMHWFLKFLLTLVGGFQIMLWVGSVLCFIVYGLDTTDTQTLALGIVLIVVVLLTSIFQAVQEGKSDNVMAALKALTPSQVSVYRDGKLLTVDAITLVPGDIVKVPLLSISGLQCAAGWNPFSR